MCFVQFLYLVFSFSLMYLVERWVPDKENGLQFRKQISLQAQRSTPFSVYILFISLLVRSLLVSLNLSLSLPVVFLLLLLLLARTNSIFNCLIVVLVHPKILHYGFPILTLNILGYNYRINNTYMKSFTFSPTFKIISLLFVIISKTNYNKKSFLIDLWL